MQNTIHNFNTGSKKQNSNAFESNYFGGIQGDFFMKVGSEQSETCQSIVMNFLCIGRAFRNALKM